MNTEQGNYETLTHTLINDTVRKVVYHTVDNGFHGLTYNHPTPLDIVDKALLFQMESGISCIFFCGLEFEQHGLDFMIEPHQYLEQSPLVDDLVNVSSYPNWSPYIGQQITGINCHWQDTYHIGIPLLYPKFIQLEFDNLQPIYISSPYHNQQSSAFHVNLEEMMVIFDEQTAYDHLAGYLSDTPTHHVNSEFDQLAV